MDMSSKNKLNIFIAHVNNSYGVTYFYYEYFLFKHLAQLTDKVLFISSHNLYHDITKQKLIRVSDKELPYVLYILSKKNIIDKLFIFFEYGAYTLRSFLVLVLFAILHNLRSKRRKVILVYHGPFISSDAYMVKPISLIAYKIFHIFMSFLARTYIVFSHSHKEKLKRIGVKNVIALPHGNHDYKDIMEIYQIESATKSLLLPVRSYALVFGIISPRKNIENVILSFLRKQNINTNLIVAGPVSKHVHTMYSSAIYKIINKKDLLTRRNIYIYDSFIDNRTAIELMKGAMVVIIPYSYDMASSGVLAFSLGLGKKILVPYSNKYFHDYVSEDCMFKSFDEIPHLIEKLHTVPTCADKWGKYTISSLAKIYLRLIDIL